MSAQFFIWNCKAEAYLFVGLTEEAPVYESGSSSRHDEGWSSEWERYTLDGDTVQREWCSDGTDCDGRLSRSGEDSCPVSELATRVPYGYTEENAPFRLPEWREEDRSQRDYSAEAAGY